MTGSCLALLMRDPAMVAALFKAARRRAANVQDQEEYVQEGWLRIARECDDDDSRETMVRQGASAIFAMYQRLRRNGYIKRGQNVTSNSIGPNAKGLVHLYANKYVEVKPERLDPWMYDGEWGECGCDRGDCPICLWHKILIGEAPKDSNAG